MPTPGTRRFVVGVTSALLAVLLLLLIADRVAPVIVERRIAATLQNTLNTPDEPQVQIDGFPFLTQLASSSYRSVRMSATEVPIPQTDGVTLRRVEAELSGVDIEGGYRLRIERVRLNATIGYPQLSELVGRPVAPAGHGRVRVELPASVRVTGRPAVDRAGRFRLNDAQYSLNGRDLPEVVADRLPELPAVPMPAPGGVAVTGVRAGPEAVRMSGAEQDLRLPR